MNITTNTETATGQSFQSKRMVVVVHDGARGATGPQGEQGEQGEQGDSIVLKGSWTPDASYCPLDAVSDMSSAADGIRSIFVQKSASPCAPSLVEPRLDPSRWDEIGPNDLSNITGAIWEVYQLAHGFEHVGTAVAFSYQSLTWVKADARMADELAIAVVREVISEDQVLLQSTGEVPYIDPEVIYPAGSDWEPGRVYYVSQHRGMLERNVPTDPDAYRQPILIPTRNHQATLPNPETGANVGVVVPWTPATERAEPERVLVGTRKFFFDLAGGETSLTGTDKYGNTLEVKELPNTDVFVNGLNLEDLVDFTVSGDGLTVTFTAPQPAGRAEVWTADEPLDLIVPATQAKFDDISGGFNGTTTVFPLTVATAPVTTATLNTLIWLDAIAQEPLGDFTVVDDPANAGFSAISFFYPPEEGTRFWGTIFIPVP